VSAAGGGWRLQRMPVHFGPSRGPRQGPDGRPFDWTGSPRRVVYAVDVLSERDALAAVLPPGFEPGERPVVTFEVQYLSELEWLAGRGYATFSARFPAVFRGERDSAKGAFLAVMWENLADPIMSGREELGYSKLYCEIPEPRVLRGEHAIDCAWLGHRFFELRMRDLTPATPPAPAAVDGVLHYKYIPRTGDWGEADVAYATLTPAAQPDLVVDSVESGVGEISFLPSRWEDLPTFHHVVDALAALPMREVLGARRVTSHGGKDLSDQRRLL